MMNRTRHITSVQLLHVAHKTTLLTHSSVYSQTDCKQINAHDLQKRCTRRCDDIAQATLVEFGWSLAALSVLMCITVRLQSR